MELMHLLDEFEQADHPHEHERVSKMVSENLRIYEVYIRFFEIFQIGEKAWGTLGIVAISFMVELLQYFLFLADHIRIIRCKPDDQYDG